MNRLSASQSAANDRRCTANEANEATGSDDVADGGGGGGGGCLTTGGSRANDLVSNV